MIYLRTPLILLALFALFTGCTKRPSPEQMNTLDARVKSAEAAEAELSSLESQHSELEGELSSAQTILEENESERDIVETKFKGE